MSEPIWRQFEKAVAAFLAALEPNARVKHDVSIPDVDTGVPRQRDVWIEVKVLGHFPITIYVSCKDVNRPLSQQSLDAIIGELRSSGANLGVVYSTGGFADNLSHAQ
jgi:Restriction endonuclease